MLEKPNLDDDVITAKLREHYGLDVVSLEFLPIGNDVGSYVYRVESHGDVYFLKARRAPMYEPSVVVPHRLNEMGLREAVAPLAASGGALWVACGAFNLILYPFIEARTGMEAGLTAQQWTQLGSVLQRLHNVELPAETRQLVMVESFERPYWVDAMQRLQAKVAASDVRDDVDAELIGFWNERRAEVDALMNRTLALGRSLRDTPRRFVLCHSDIHTANVLVEPGGALHIVDWDQPIFAPKERDLMFFGTGMTIGGSEDDARRFYEGYGPTRLDREAFTYYRYAWVMQDWVAYGAEVLLHDDLGELTRRNSLRRLREMFTPGDVVDVAYASDARLRRE